MRSAPKDLPALGKLHHLPLAKSEPGTPGHPGLFQDCLACGAFLVVHPETRVPSTPNGDARGIAAPVVKRVRAYLANGQATKRAIEGEVGASMGLTEVLRGLVEADALETTGNGGNARYSLPGAAPTKRKRGGMDGALEKR
jgi:hypothetical protein